MDDISLEKGKIVFHKTNKTAAVILDVSNESVLIELEHEIADIKTLKLPLTHFGEWLFFDIKDIDAPVEKLSSNPTYLKYGNSKLLKSLEKRNDLLIYLKSRYQFHGFLHYSDFSNYIKIMKDGYLKCRNELSTGQFKDAADSNVIEKTRDYVKTHVRFFYKGMTPTLYSNEGIKIDNADPHMPIPVLMIFDEQIIHIPNVKFLSGCGGSNYTLKYDNQFDALERMNWDEIFRRGQYGISDTEHGAEALRAKITNNRNAEFLVPNKISTEHIKRIVFRCEADRFRAKVLLGDDIRYSVDKRGDYFFKQHNGNEYFRKNINYVEDYFIFREADSINIALKFHSPNFSSYSNKIKIYCNDGKTFEFNIPDETYCIQLEKLNISLDIFIKLKSEISRNAKNIEITMNGYISAVWSDGNDKVF